MKAMRMKRAAALMLSLIMVVTMMSLMGTREAWAVSNEDPLTIDLSSSMWTTDDSGLGDEIINILIGANEAGAARFTIFATMSSQWGTLYIDKDDTPDVVITIKNDPYQMTIAREDDFRGQDFTYNGLTIVTAEKVAIKNALTMHFYDDVREYDGADAAAINAFISDAIRSNVISYRITSGTDDYTVADFDINQDGHYDVTGEFVFEGGGRICTHVTMTLAPDFKTNNSSEVVWADLPDSAFDRYENMRLGNEYGIEYVYKDITFDARFNKQIRWSAVELSAAEFKYNGEVQKPALATIQNLGDMDLVEGTHYEMEWSDASSTDIGTYEVTVKGINGYEGSRTFQYSIVKADNTLKASGKTAAVKFSKLKKKSQTLKASKVMKFASKGEGKLTYKRAKGNKKIAISKTTGKVTVKKGLKKGTYTVKVKIQAAGDDYHDKSAWKTVTFKVKVK